MEPGMPAGNVESTNVKTGTETVEVGEKKVEASTKEMDVKLVQEENAGPGIMRSSGESHVKVWTSAEVPGGIVKTVVTRNRPFKVVITTSVVRMSVVREAAATTTAPATGPGTAPARK